MTLRLVAGQTGHGGWGYQCPRLNDDQHKGLFDLLRQVRNQVGAQVPKLTSGTVADLPEHLRKLALLRSQPDLSTPVAPSRFESSYDDNSNTQFAVLALLTARNYDLPLDRTLALVARRFRITQLADGGWKYRFTGDHIVSDFPTMTCAGLLGLAVGHSLVKDARGRGEKLRDLTSAAELTEDSNIQKALRFLGEHIGVNMDNKLDLYYLWSVERVGVIFHLAKIGGKEWYPWGVDVLLARQENDGSWHGNHKFPSAVTVDTSWALLFLKRADLAKGLTRKLQVEAGD
jgi:hypothetical protein